MKAFKKCWSENSGPHRFIDSNHCEIAEYYWRAALEQVNSKLRLADGQVANEVKEWIKQELEEK